MYLFKRIFDLRGRAPGLRFVKDKKNEIGAGFIFWELNGDELHRFNEVKVSKGAVKVLQDTKRFAKGKLKVREGA